MHASYGAPKYTVHIDRLEKVQKTFLKFLDYETGHFFFDYESTANMYNIDFLNSRLVFLDKIFEYKILNGDMNSALLL